MKRYLRTGFGTAAILVLLALIAGNWGDFKLRVLAPARSYLTISNNPLLKSFDTDLQGAMAVSSESGHKAVAPRVDPDDILSGGPPKDGIPSVDNPRFDFAGTTPFGDDEKIIGVVINGEAKAYPYGVLNWHEIVNDTVAGVPVSVTYCPLCDTGIVFSRKLNGGVTTFGVSGKLYQSCLVMYDRKTDSLYSQPWGTGIMGASTNVALKRFPAVKTKLGAWLKVHPKSKILSPRTGYRRDYFQYPYGNYYTDEYIIFPIRNLNKLKTGRKTPVTYVWSADGGTPAGRFSGASAYVVQSELKKKGNMILVFGGRKITARWDAELDTPRFFDASGTELPSSSAFGFVWPAFFE